MIRRGRWGLPLAAGCLLLIVAGASTAASSAPATTRTPVAHYLRLIAPDDLGGNGISLKPVPAGQPAPPISGPQAARTCAACDPALIPNVYLALASKPENGMVDRLVWVVDFPRSSCVPLGIPPLEPGNSALLKRAITPYPCRLVNLVDSNTGQLLWAMRF